MKLITLSVSLLILCGAMGLAQDEPPGPSTLTPLSQALNPDGTVKAGITGSLDPTGYKLLTDATGQPMFVPAGDVGIQAVGDEKWDGRFGGAFAPNGPVRVIAVNDSDCSVWVGGQFTTAGGVSAMNIARWDGIKWSALGSGVGLAGDHVRAIAFDGTTAYAGGHFRRQGGNHAYINIAKWNGSSWSEMCGALETQVCAIAVAGGYVYAGGMITSACGVAVNHLVRWNGASWTEVGGGVSGGFYLGRTSVRALAVNGSDVYVGGYFAQAGGSAAANLARWNGALNRWEWAEYPSTPQNPDGSVNAILVDGGNLWIGGGFIQIGSSNNYFVAKYDSVNHWRALGSGVGDVTTSDDAVLGLAKVGGRIYAVGGFYIACGVTNMGHVASWNAAGDNCWHPAGTGVDGGEPFAAAATCDDMLLVGGDFTSAGGHSAPYLATWDGTAWAPEDDLGVNGEVYAVAVRGGNVLVGGFFSKVGSLVSSNLALWAGSAWMTLGTVDGVVRAIGVDGTNAYVGGDFHFVDGVSAQHIAKWNASGWSALGLGVNDRVRAIATRGNEVYAGGEFTTAGGSGANKIAKWDGSAWSALGSGLSRSAFPGIAICSAIAVSGNDVYAGGNFDHAGGVSAERVAKWNGTAWSPLGSGVIGSGLLGAYVYAVAAHGSDIYVGGSFTNAGGTEARNIARWDGSQWLAMGAANPPLFQYRGVNDTVYGIAVNGTNVYVTGVFTSAGSWPLTTAAGVACWNGKAWSALGSGLNTNGYAIAVQRTNVYVGGPFTTAGLKPSSHFGIWNGGWFAPPEIVGIKLIGGTNAVISFIPSPSRPHELKRYATMNTAIPSTRTNLVTGLGGTIELNDYFSASYSEFFYRIYTTY